MSSLVRLNSNFDLTHEKLEFILQKIFVATQNRVEKAYVFGSAATGDFSRNSDIDLIFIQSTTTPFTERALVFSDLFDIYPRLDILVYTQAEFERQLADSNVGFWKSVRLSLRLIENVKSR